jgi:acetyl esterase/lipase
VGAAVLSPVTDLALTGERFETRSEADPYFVRAQIEGLVRSYLGDTDPKNPLASPLYGNLAGLPPISIHVGDDEVLLDDSRRYFERAVAAGVDAKLGIWEGMPHGFVGSIGQGSPVICANDYSYLKATIGSTRIARRAGM